MSLIKDKYSKSSKSRSRHIIDRKVVKTPIISEYKTTEQKLSQSATERRAETNTENITKNISTISGRELATVNTVENVFTLKAGTILKDIIISHYHGSGSESVISLHWSGIPITDLTFTVSAGVITDIEGGNAFRLFTDTFISQSTLSLASGGLFNTFENINKPIYFYAVCSVLGPTFTVVRNDEKKSTKL